MADKVNPILERAAEQWTRQRGGEVSVPEWGETPEKPLVIYFDRANFRDKSKMFKKHQANNLEYLVDAIIDKAKTGPEADAPKMFSEADRFFLMSKVDPDVVMRIGNEILKGIDASVGDATKN